MLWNLNSLQKIKTFINKNKAINEVLLLRRDKHIYMFNNQFV